MIMINFRNSDGLTPLEVAIHEGSLYVNSVLAIHRFTYFKLVCMLIIFRDCAMAVVESDQWLTALRRYNSKTESTPFRELISRMPGLGNSVHMCM